MSDRQLRQYRVLGVLAGGLLLAFGGIQYAASPDAVDPFWLRLVLTGLCLGLVGASYVSRWIRKHFFIWVQGLCYTLTAWYISLAAWNGYTADYTIGLPCVLFAFGLVLRLGHKRSGPALRYFVFATAWSVLVLFAAPQWWEIPPAQVSPLLILGVVLSTSTLAFYVSSYWSKQAQQDLDRSQERFAAAVQGSLDAFFLLEARRDHDGQVADFEVCNLNERGEQLLGRSRSEIVGQRARTLIGGGDARAFIDRCVHVLEKRAPFEAEVANTLSDIGAEWVHYQVVPVGDGVAVTIRDITQRKEAEREVNRLNNFYEHVLDSMPTQLAVLDREGRFVYINPNTVSDPALRKWLIGKTDIDYCRRRNKDLSLARQRRRRISRVVETGETLRFEETMRSREGAEKHFMRLIAPVMDADGEVTQVLGYGLDITERKQAEEELKASEQRYRMLMESANDAIFVADAETGAILDANRKAEELTGYSLDRLTSMHQTDLHPADEHDHYRTLFEDHVQSGSAVTEGLVVVHQSGKCVPVDISVSLIELGGRSVIQAIFRNVTDRHRYEQQLIEAKEHAEEMLRLKTSFLNNMSHEIRTPIASILGYAEVLVEEIEGHQRDFAVTITQSARRLQKTLDSVLDLAQLESGETTLDLEPLDVAAEVREVTAVLHPLAQKKGLEVIVEAPDAVQSCLDASCLHRILNNLVGNAVKFTDEGHVRVTVEADEEGVHVEVEDTGIGISDDFAEHIFDEFRQESSGLTRSHDGTGLGLTITRHLVELMDGGIRVESEKGVGSTFTLSFPDSTGCECETDASPEVPSAPDEEAEGARAVILVLEDNPDTRTLIGRRLSTYYEVEVVGTPEEALELARQNRYDLLLLDINLGTSMDGLDVLEVMRTLPLHGETPAIAVTAYAMPGDRERFLEAGFDGYLSKPFTKMQLFGALEAHLQPAVSAEA